MTDDESASPVNTAASFDGADALEAVIRSIGGHARATNLARARHLADAVGDAAALFAGDARARAADVAHQIAGSAGTFGFPRASDLAAEIEHLFLRSELDPDHLEIARGHVQELLTDLKGEPTY